MPGTATPSRAYHHGDLPNALMDAVEALLLESGVEGVSLRKAAKLAGVSHAAPAHHFGDLHGLLYAVAERGHDRFAEALRNACDAAGDVPLSQRLQATGLAYVQFAEANQGVFSVMFAGEISDQRVNEPAVGSESFRVLTELIGEGLGIDVDVCEEDPDGLRLALFVWATVHGVAELWVQRTMIKKNSDLTLESFFALVAHSVQHALEAEPRWIAS